MGFEWRTLIDVLPPSAGLELCGGSTSKLNDNPNDIPNDNLKITSKLNDSQMIARMIT